MKKPALLDPRAIQPPTVAEIAAIKAVAQGTATDEQQRRFMGWLINEACGYGPPRTFFGEDAALKSYLAMGRQRVAEILKTYIETPIERFKADRSPTEQP